MNFIFDIGNVLVDFKPKEFLREVVGNREDEVKIDEIIFKSAEWIMLDEGVITHQQACEIFCNREPEYKELIIKVMNKIPDMLKAKLDTVEYLSKIKALGHKLYYLSNYHVKLSRYILDKYSFFEMFDGGVFSCDIHMIKPSAAIYRYFLSKYNLSPQECIFFDDTLENIVAAEKEGIKAVLFTDAKIIGDIIKNIDG